MESVQHGMDDNASRALIRLLSLVRLQTNLVLIMTALQADWNLQATQIRQRRSDQFMEERWLGLLELSREFPTLPVYFLKQAFTNWSIDLVIRPWHNTETRRSLANLLVSTARQHTILGRVISSQFHECLNHLGSLAMQLRRAHTIWSTFPCTLR